MVWYGIVLIASGLFLIGVWAGFGAGYISGIEDGLKWMRAEYAEKKKESK